MKTITGSIFLGNVSLLSKVFVIRSVVFCSEYLVASEHLLQSYNVKVRSCVSLQVLSSFSLLIFRLCKHCDFLPASFSPAK